MSIMATSVVQELGIMHLVTCSEYYKIVLGVVTQPLGKKMKYVQKLERYNVF
jgi:hypothetical protein